ncbi:MAG: tetratricopeptide repeat protein, partial [Flavobacteriales bacterium]
MRPNIIRLIALILGLFGIAQVYAEPLDSLGARLVLLPLDSLLQREKTTTDLRVKCVLMNVMVGNYLYLDRQEECMRAAMRALEMAEQLKNDTLIGRAQVSIAGAFALVNDVNAALTHYNTSLTINERTGDSLAMGFVCKEIAALYRGLGDTDGSLRYMHRALAYGMNPKVRARGMAVMTKCYLELGNLDSALYCAQQADIVKRPGEDPYGYSGYQGNLGAVYAARHEPDLAETYFKRAVAVADSFHLPQPLITAAAGYSKLLIEQGRTAEALALARKGFEATEGVRQPSLIVKAAGALADAFHADRMDDSAFVYSKLCNAYRDTVTNTQNRSQMQNQLFS